MSNLSKEEVSDMQFDLRRPRTRQSTKTTPKKQEPKSQSTKPTPKKQEPKTPSKSSPRPTPKKLQIDQRRGKCHHII